LAGIAATASVVPITIANANHTKGEKGLPDFISWKDRDALIVHLYYNRLCWYGLWIQIALALPQRKTYRHD